MSLTEAMMQFQDVETNRNGGLNGRHAEEADTNEGMVDRLVVALFKTAMRSRAK